MDIFSLRDYKTVLREKIRENKGSVGYKGKLAEAAGCQRAYLSQVLGSHVHLTPDHAAGLALFWSLPPFERDYFLELVALERAATPNLKRLIESKLEQIRREQASVSGRIKRPKIESIQLQSHYYSSWHFSAIHILITVANFRTLKSISQRLNLTEDRTRAALMLLEQMGLAKRDGEKWLPVSFDLHLPAHSPLTAINHMNWRQRAIQDAQDERTDGVHFTAVMSLDEASFAQIKNQMLQQISKTREIAVQAPEEDLVCFTCDFFRV
jgi:uncharacterized protein (TIGR02147 family)